MVNNEQLDLLIEDLGLVPSTLLTPSLKDLILKEQQFREFQEFNEYERYYQEQYLNQLSKRKKKKQPVISEDDLILFEDGLS
jgi:hypothetical protein